MDITEYDTLTPEEASSVLALAHRAEAYDAVSPLNEDATLAITHSAGHHLLARAGSTLIAYAYVDPPEANTSAQQVATDPAYSAAQLMVEPTYRRHGIATQLLSHLHPHTDLWAFANLDPARYFCASQGFAPVRGLLVMELQPLSGNTPDYGGDPASGRMTTGGAGAAAAAGGAGAAAGWSTSSAWAAPGGGVPHWRKMGNPKGISHLSTSGVLGAAHLNPYLGLGRMSKLLLPSTCVGVGSLRGRPPQYEADSAFGQITIFQPEDLQNLVNLNARSFANHPEQGRMTVQDFMERMESDWFDPNGLLIAKDDTGTMIGFHWTKVENGIGEVYVLGVDPDHAGSGVGSTLLDAGLAYLTSQGVNTVRLWVDDDNIIAQSLYMKSGFSPIRHDIRYRR